MGTKNDFQQIFSYLTKISNKVLKIENLVPESAKKGLFSLKRVGHAYGKHFERLVRGLLEDATLLVFLKINNWLRWSNLIGNFCQIWEHCLKVLKRAFFCLKRVGNILNSSLERKYNDWFRWQTLLDISVKYERISWRLFLVLIRALFWFKACRTHFGWRTLLVHLKIYRNEAINHIAVFTPKEMYLLGSHIRYIRVHVYV